MSAYSYLLTAVRAHPSLSFLVEALEVSDSSNIDSVLVSQFGEAPRNAMSWFAITHPPLMPLAVLAGANVNQYCVISGQTPLYRAVRVNDLATAQRLLDLGADLTIGVKGFDSVIDGQMPILCAMGLPKPYQMTSLLLSAGART